MPKVWHDQVTYTAHERPLRLRLTPSEKTATMHVNTLSSVSKGCFTYSVGVFVHCTIIERQDH